MLAHQRVKERCIMSNLIISKFPKKGNRKMKNDEDLRFAISIIALLLVVMGLAIVYIATKPAKQEEIFLKAEPIVTEQATEPVEIVEELSGGHETVEVTVAEEVKEEKKPILSDEEIMAKVVHAEAKGEKLLGQVLVAYTILNRVDYRGMTVESVVKEPNQYSYDESIKPTDANYRAVIIAELIRDFIPDLLPDTMMWFQAGDYHKGDDCGVPYIHVGGHYFNYLPESED